jgi:hypothetical protein
MSRIIAGRFDVTLDADAALAELKAAGFHPEEIDSFYVSPPGQNDLAPLGGDAPHSSAGSKRAGIGAAVGAVVGCAVGLGAGYIASQDLGPVVVALGAALGAYIGSFAGAMTKVRGAAPQEATREHPVESRGGRMIAVRVDRPGTEPRAIEILKRHRARDVGRAEGDWRNGSWRDFDPRTPLGTA